MDRRHLIGALTALTCLPVLAACRSTRFVTVVDAEAVAGFRAALDDLQDAIGDSPARFANAETFLFGVGQPPWAEIRGVPTPGTNEMVLTFQVSERFRDFTRALRAGKSEDQAIEKLAHGSSCG